MSKYELTSTSITFTYETISHTCYQIKATSSFTVYDKYHGLVLINNGDLGGYIESTDNLSQDGNCWVFNSTETGTTQPSTLVCGNSRITDNAIVYRGFYIDCNFSGNAYACIETDTDIYTAQSWWLKPSTLFIAHKPVRNSTISDNGVIYISINDSVYTSQYFDFEITGSTILDNSKIQLILCFTDVPTSGVHKIFKIRYTNLYNYSSIIETANNSSPELYQVSIEDDKLYGNGKILIEDTCYGTIGKCYIYGKSIIVPFGESTSDKSAIKSCDISDNAYIKRVISLGNCKINGSTMIV